MSEEYLDADGLNQYHNGVLDLLNEKLSLIKGILTGAADVDSLVTKSDTGFYYLNNVTTTPDNYGILVVISPYEEGYSAYQMIISNTVYVREYYSSVGSWYEWRKSFSISNIDALGPYIVSTFDTDKKSIAFGTKAYLDASNIHGLDAVPTGRTINNVALSSNVVLKSSNFSEAITGEKMLANLLYTTVRTRTSGLTCIGLPSNVYFDASSLGGIRGTITTSGVIDTLIAIEQSGVYYCSNVSDAPTGYGMLIVLSAGEGTAAVYQIYIPSTMTQIFVRYRSSSTWGTWYVYGGSAWANNGIAYTGPKIYNFSIAKNVTKTLKFDGSAYGQILFCSTYTDIRGGYVFMAESGGNVRTTAFAAPTGITLSTSTNGLAITNNTGNTSASVTVSVWLAGGNIKSVT